MIKRILDPKEFKILLSDVFVIFEEDNEENGHALLKHNKDYIYNAFGHKSILAWDFFVWGNLNEYNKFDAVIAFVNNKNEKFGKEIFAEYIWLSDNPRVGRKLLSKAVSFAKETASNKLYSFSTSTFSRAALILLPCFAIYSSPSLFNPQP